MASIRERFAIWLRPPVPRSSVLVNKAERDTTDELGVHWIVTFAEVMNR